MIDSHMLQRHERAEAEAAKARNNEAKRAANEPIVANAKQQRDEHKVVVQTSQPQQQQQQPPAPRLSDNAPLLPKLESIYTNQELLSTWYSNCYPSMAKHASIAAPPSIAQYEPYAYQHNQQQHQQTIAHTQLPQPAYTHSSYSQQQQYQPQQAQHQHHYAPHAFQNNLAAYNYQIGIYQQQQQQQQQQQPYGQQQHHFLHPYNQFGHHHQQQQQQTNFEAYTDTATGHLPAVVDRSKQSSPIYDDSLYANKSTTSRDTVHPTLPIKRSASSLSRDRSAPYGTQKPAKRPAHEQPQQQQLLNSLSPSSADINNVCPRSSDALNISPVFVNNLPPQHHNQGGQGKSNYQELNNDSDDSLNLTENFLSQINNQTLQSTNSSTSSFTLSSSATSSTA